MKRSWVYILECNDKSYYVGCTSNLQQRIAQHNAGLYGGYTAARRPVKLVWSSEFHAIREAINAERRLKKWTRAKKEALMAGNFELLHELSRSTRTKMKLGRE
ncbi:MAG TPA: GIY-YIG nuclease family protein [Bacteroidota bacterium]|nr:GIY-YIG nuclease family protein [Bacteroidota bacterium]